MSEHQASYRKLPAVDALLALPAIVGALGHLPRWAVVSAIRRELAQARAEIRDGDATTLLRSDGAFDHDGFATRVIVQARATSQLPLRRVINGTGVLIHTNLGRAPLGSEALAAVCEVARGYCNLEYTLPERQRGSRHDHPRALLIEFLGCEDAMVVNNNAAATLLALTAVASGREVIVCRSQLVEIGGSFRMPDVMALSGAKMVEVGTTNKTHLLDYATAINEGTGALLKVHQSNFRIVGFTKSVPTAALVQLAHSHNLPVIEDLGSGCLTPLPHAERTVQEALSEGVDLVCFSGDKLLGGPQAGILVGRTEQIARCRQHPLARAVRVDKMTLAALCQTLLHILDGQLMKIPILAMMAVPQETLRQRAREICDALGGLGALTVAIADSVAHTGGGSLPEQSIPSVALQLSHPSRSPGTLERQLRAHTTPVLCRISDNHVLIDLRAIADTELRELVDAIGQLC